MFCVLNSSGKVIIWSPMSRNVCVFCGANNNVAKEYKDLARECGELLAMNNMNVIYGGGDTGLMGAVSKAAKANGSQVTGVFPIFIEKHEKLNHDLDNTVFVNTMFERKELLLKDADSFLILPGGFGTLDELFEVLTLKGLSQLEQPIILLNYKNYWTPLLNLMEYMIELGFARKNMRTIYDTVSNMHEAIELLKKC